MTILLRRLLWAALFFIGACGAPASPTAEGNAPTLIAPTLPPTAVAATQDSEASTPANQPTAAQLTTAPQPANPTAVALREGDPRILAYNPNGNTLAFYDLNGNAESLAVGTTRTLAIPCFVYENNLVLHFGSDISGVQEIYHLGGGKALPLGENNGLACTLRGGMQLSSDGALLGVMRYRSDAARGNYTVGTLRLIELATLNDLTTLDNVNSFTFSGRNAVVVQFFADSQGVVPSVDVRLWDGTRTQRIVTELPASEGCNFVSSTLRAASDAFYIVFGERCTGRPSQWRLVRVSTDGNYAEVGKGNTGGAYLTFSALNQLHILSTTEALLVYPNGLDASVANLGRLSLETGALTPVMNGIVVERHPPDMPVRFTFNTDGSWLAMVTRDGNGDERLYLYAVDGEGAPVAISGAGREARIPALVWAADGRRLYYLTRGGTEALYSVELGDDLRPRLIARGRFQGLVITPNGDQAVLSKQVQEGRDLLNHFVLIETTDGNESMIREGKKDEAALQPLAIR